MNVAQIERHTRTELERVSGLKATYEGAPIPESAIFQYSAVVKGINETKALQPGFSVERVLAALPFTPKLFTFICPSCAGKPDAITPFLEAGVLVPVLRADYDLYDPRFVSLVLKHPHVSLQEWDAYRWHKLRYAEGADPASTTEITKQINALLNRVSRRKNAAAQGELIRDIYLSLRPYVGPDPELVDELSSAIERKDLPTAVRISRLSVAVDQVRSAMLINADLDIRAEELALLHEMLPSFGDASQRHAIQITRERLADGLGLTIPEGMAPDKYLEIVLAHRESLQRIYQAAVDNEHGRMDADRAVGDYIATLNEEIRTAERSMRGKVLRASVSLVRSNKTLAAATLAGVTLGLLASFATCTVAAGTRLARKWGERRPKIRIDPAVSAVGEEIGAELAEPVIQRALSLYYGMSMPAVRVWRLQRDLQA
ncbi:MAG TPA: hypothetical protein VF006_05165 [Longimicrobium sp.]